MLFSGLDPSFFLKFLLNEQSRSVLLFNKGCSTICLNFLYSNALPNVPILQPSVLQPTSTRTCKAWRSCDVATPKGTVGPVAVDQVSYFKQPSFECLALSAPRTGVILLNECVFHEGT